MKLELVKHEAYKESTWTHGVTTELYIHPSDGDYSKRLFKWRISSASVDVDRSEFTSLYGVKRWIMSFDNALHLTHTNNGKALYSITLNAYESHCFRGDWTTICEGRAKDFNLMLKDDAYGILKSAKLMPETEKELGSIFYEAFDERLPLDGHRLTIGLYSVMGDLYIKKDEVVNEIPKEALQLIHFKMDEIDLVKQMAVLSRNDHLVKVAMFVVSY